MEVGDILTLDIESTGSSGEGVARYEGVTVFVKGAIDGERVLARVSEVSRSFCRAKMTKVIRPSIHRVSPDCKCYGLCSGCDLLHVDYDYTLEIKSRIVRDTLLHVGGMDVEVRPTVPSPKEYRYRNKLALPIGVSRDGLTKIGFYREKSHDIVPITDCVLQGEWIVPLISSVRALCDVHHDFRDNLRHVVVREAGGLLMVTFVLRAGSVPDVERFASSIENVASVYLSLNDRDTNVIMGEKLTKVYGEDTLTSETLGVRYTLSPYSFAQVNDGVRDLIYSEVASHIRSDDVVIDAYSGAGLMTSIVGAIARETYGIEIVGDAVRDADVVKLDNGLKDRVTNICGDCADILPRLVKNLMRRRDIKDIKVILDPPRKGCDSRVLDAVLDAQPHSIIYVSCNPATLARDLKSLCRDYDILSVTPYDMFPYTKHVETICLLSKKK